MKNLLFGLLILAASDATPAMAQLAGSWSGLSDTTPAVNGGTNAIVANTTNAVAARLDAPRAENILIVAKFKLFGAGTSAVEFILAPGDEVSYATNNAVVHRWNITANGTTTVCGITNIALGGIPHLWVISQGHNNATAVTNLSIQYGSKR